MNNKKILILAGASWSWKDTLKNKIEENLWYKNLISTTTRNKREGEKNDIHYKFIDRIEFENKIENNEFIEFALFNDNYYGKQVIDLNKLLINNYNVITILETHWVKNILKYKDNFINKWYDLNIVFLDISKETIKNRMLKRWDNIIDIEKRLNNNDYEYFQELKDIADIILNADNSPELLYNDLILKLDL